MAPKYRTVSPLHQKSPEKKSDGLRRAGNSGRNKFIFTECARGIACLLALAMGFIPLKSPAQEGHWVTTWGCGPQLVEPRNLPPVPLAVKTLRQFVHVSIGGDRLRVRFSNAYGKEPVRILSARVALATGVGSGGEGNINTRTDLALSFHGRPSAEIPAGQAILSNPFAFDLPALTNLAISIYFGNVSATSLNGHPGSRTTSFIEPGDVARSASMPAAQKTEHWYIITGVDVWAHPSAAALITLGDSITDGRGSTTDGNNRWPDDLAQRLQTNAPTAGVAVVNMGIGGNGIFGGLGPSALARFDRDALGQSGVRWIILFEGVNDIGGDRTGHIGAKLIAAYKKLADKAHEKNLAIYGATITPFGGNGYYTASHEAARERVNAWFRTNAVFDGVIDFDAIARDPETRTNLYGPFDSGDHLHLNPDGYQAMANGINLKWFTRRSGRRTVSQ
ncbi:MAG: SGNH/GDSL hydrolase family protein [Limisphaerales bacterium]